MTIQANFPAIKPSLMLDFANVRQLDPRITFTRASTATYYGTETAKAEENLLLQSQTFETTWSVAATNATVTANTSTAPDGTTTADTLTEDSATGIHACFQGVITSGVVTLSVFAKLGSGTRFLTIAVNRDATHSGSATFDLSLGTNTQTQANGGIYASPSATITAVAQGFYRCTFTVTTDTVSQVRIGLNDTGTPATNNRGLGAGYTGNNTSSIILWGAQLEQRSAVTAYTATTTQAITNYIPVLESQASGVARFDNNPTTFESLGLLIEESRTNLQTNSGSATGWTVNLNTTPNLANAQGIAPDGTNTAVGIPYGATGVVQSNLTVTSDTNTYTFSFYAKSLTGAGTVSTGTLGFAPPNDYFAGTIFNFSTLALGSGWSATAVGNGWYRLSRSFVNTSQTTFINAVSTTTGVVLLWGPQLELGAFATSYIPTVASQVTRAADAASMTGTNFSSWFNAGEGTVYAEFVPAQATSLTTYALGIGDGATASNYFGFRLASGSATMPYVANGASQANLTLGSYQANTAFKVIGAYKVNDFGGALNAGTVATDTSGVISNASSSLEFGSVAGGTSRYSGTIKKIAYYPLRVTNANLQALTS